MRNGARAAEVQLEAGGMTGFPWRAVRERSDQSRGAFRAATVANDVDATQDPDT